MPFPIAIDGQPYDTPRALAAEIMRRALAGKRPDRDLASAAQTGALSSAEAVGLCAALIQTGQPAPVAAGARLAKELGDSSLCRLLLLAHEALDIGTLLQATDEAVSVEDLILSAASSILPDDATLRAEVLRLLRHASLVADETRVLAKYGSPEEIAFGLPGVVLEGLPPNTAAPLAQALLRGEDIAQVITPVLQKLDPSDLATLWAAATRLGVHHTLPDLRERLFPDAT